MSERLMFESLGGGWQSSALLLMSVEGLVPKLDGAIFADTQNEMPETYDYLEFLAEKAADAGIPVIRATAGNLYSDVFEKAGKGKLQRLNGYTCSYDYKRRVVTREVRKLTGPRGAWKKSSVDQWIGYTTDEVSRMKPDFECRCGHSKTHTVSKRTGRERGHDAGRRCLECACERWEPWRVNRWPLITDLSMTRQDCRRWIISHGYPEPPRSACWMCPNRGNAHWRDLRDNRPELWQRAVQLDEFGRHGYNKLNGAAYLHQSGVPLAGADLRPGYQRLSEDHGIEPLFSDEVDMDCDAGVCFT